MLELFSRKVLFPSNNILVSGSIYTRICRESAEHEKHIQFSLLYHLRSQVRTSKGRWLIVRQSTWRPHRIYFDGSIFMVYDHKAHAANRISVAGYLSGPRQNLPFAAGLIRREFTHHGKVPWTDMRWREHIQYEVNWH